MEFSQIFGFLKIWRESLKLALKNAKSILAITLLSLLTTSILFLLFSFCYQTATTYMTNSIINSSLDISNLQMILQMVLYLTLLLSVELVFLFACIAISHASGIATILASAASYSDSKLSLQDLYSRFKIKWKSPIRKNLRGSRGPMLFLSILAVGLATFLVIFYWNPLTITILSVAGVALFVYQLYRSVVIALSAIIVVVDDGCEAEEATERAEKLVEGQRIHGFMVNLLLNLLGLLMMWGCWMILGDKRSLNLNLMVYGLIFMNFASLTRIYISVVYTAYYFHCTEYHGQTVKLFGGSPGYTVLPTDIL